MAERRISIILNGVTGRMGRTQHLRALMDIRAEGGILLADGSVLVPEPLLVGRDARRLEDLSSANGGLPWSTDLDACLSDAGYEIFFDAAATAGRAERTHRAIAAGKHVYVEKPIAGSLDEAMSLASAAEAAGVRHGVVQDKLFLPGLQKLRSAIESGEIGKLISARLDFGWWIFDGHPHPSQRPSWNYKRESGGGLVLDMFPHWRYIIDGLFGDISAVCCRMKIGIPKRRDESGAIYSVDVEDEVFALFELQGGALVRVDSSWTSRVRRSDLLMLQADGTEGSAVASLHDCWLQPLAATPQPVWNVDKRQSADFFADWLKMPDVRPHKNSFRSCWEAYLRHVAEGAAFPSPLIAGARGVQFADAAYRSDSERRWVDLPKLET